MFVFIRGAGDLATGISVRLYRAGIKICHSDLAIPTAVRRNVAFSEAIRLGKTEVEGIEAVLAQSPEDVFRKMEEGKVPVVIDEGKEMLKKLKPYAVVDAIIAKKNLGTEITDANVVIGVGPGFTAGVDCHAVIESKRGHNRTALWKILSLSELSWKKGISVQESAEIPSSPLFPEEFAACCRREYPCMKE